MDIIKTIAKELEINASQVQSAVELLDDGCTVPFISRYRKEKTGGLNDEVLRSLSARLTYLRNLQDKKDQVISAIESLDKMTDELRAKLDAAMTLVEVEDLYRPYRPKRRTRASIAREKGLEGLAALIRLQRIRRPLEEEAAAYVSEDKGVANVQEAIDGAKDIIAEDISDDAALRSRIRDITSKEGKIISSAKGEKPDPVYEIYFDYEETLRTVPGHRVLALDRGEKEKQLSVKIEAPSEKITDYIERRLIKGDNPYTVQALKEAAKDAYSRLIAPSIENEIRAMLTEKAQDKAIEVFGKNLKQLLMQPPVAGHVILGWDPAFRTGCKLAVVDETGKVLDTAVIYPTAPTSAAKQEQARRVLENLINKYNISLFSVGNGTASRESEQFIAEFLKSIPKKVQYVIVSEAGASVYSASELATEEFPEFDVGQRSAASIARRLQDPLAELVKIDPKSIGVGQYQHDMNQKKLSEALDAVVEDCVNAVGVDLNTASAPLLENVSGITKTVARNIVSWREENGSFTNRSQLKKVARLGPKVFEQCAGFMRIKNGTEPLDNTAVHPESYPAAKLLMKELSIDEKQFAKGGVKLQGKIGDLKAMASKTGVGEPTLKDIISELEKPGRDPREDLPRPVLRSDVLEMKDLVPGMILKGTVRNVIDFGVFVDIGVHQDGLVHISQLTNKKYVKHPMEVVSVGDVVDVKVLSVDQKRKRISLTMKGIS